MPKAVSKCMNCSLALLPVCVSVCPFFLHFFLYTRIKVALANGGSNLISLFLLGSLLLTAHFGAFVGLSSPSSGRAQQRRWRFWANLRETRVKGGEERERGQWQPTLYANRIEARQKQNTHAHAYAHTHSSLFFFLFSSYTQSTQAHISIVPVLHPLCIPISCQRNNRFFNWFEYYPAAVGPIYFAHLIIFILSRVRTEGCCRECVYLVPVWIITKGREERKEGGRRDAYQGTSKGGKK